MKALIIYDSQYGNTEKIAWAIADQIRDAIPTQVQSVNAGMPDLYGLDLLIVGGPTQGHTMSHSMRNFFNMLPDHSLDGVEVAAFDTRLKMVKLITGSAASPIEKALRRKGGIVIAGQGSFLVTGSEGPLVEGELQRARVWAESVLDAAEIRTQVPVH